MQADEGQGVTTNTDGNGLQTRKNRQYKPAHLKVSTDSPMQNCISTKASYTYLKSNLNKYLNQREPVVIKCNQYCLNLTVKKNYRGGVIRNE